MAAPLKIAVVEDNDDLRNLLVRNIQRHGYAVKGADCAEALDELMMIQPFDLIVLDLNLPSENGLSIAKRYKATNPNLFIIMITARNQTEDRVHGYEYGADIYLTKPFAQAELLAAIGSLAKRIQSNLADEAQIYFDPIKMVLLGGEAIVLSEDEALILNALMTADSHKLPYYRLLEFTHKEITSSSKSNLEVQITRLRKKLVKAGSPPFPIRSIRGDGYQLLTTIYFA